MAIYSVSFVVVVLLMLPLGFAQPISLHAPATVPIQSSIEGFVSADFNRDGKPDVAVLADGAILVFLGNGDGTFQPHVSFLTTGACLAAGDVNGDGKVDLIASGSAGNSVLLGNGDGTFAAPIQSAGGGCPFVVGDFSGDGKPDIAWISSSGLGIQLGDGQGHFSAAKMTEIINTFSLVAGDFNKDGKLDIAVALARSDTGAMGVLLGNGDGTFSSVRIYGPPQQQPGGIAAADFNQDGNLDLAMTAGVGFRTDQLTIYTFLGNGDGSFQPPLATPGGTNILIAGDLNGDGKPDLIAGESYLLGKGDGTFQAPVFIAQPSTSCVPSGTHAYCSYANLGAAIADFNQDGLPDIAVATVQGLYSDNLLTQNYSLSVLLQGKGMPRFAATGVSAASFQEPVTTGSRASAFGSELADMTASAQAPPWPTSLGGIQLRFRDYQGTVHLAPLLFVSPGQINYQVPPDIPDGVASITVDRAGAPVIEAGQAIMDSYDGAPSLFTVNDQGLAAATAVRVHPNGTQTAVPVYACDAPSPCKAVPISVTGDPVILSLYGTGFEVDAVLLNYYAVCTVNSGTPIAPAYFGPQGQYPGLDQANLALPANLAGSGDTTISCQFIGVVGGVGPTNSVHVTIQ